MVKTFLDTGVLIDAARSELSIAARALEVLDDPDRTFVSSRFVELEVFPKAVYHKKAVETAFYQKFFQRVQWVSDYEALLAKAHEIACQYGLHAMDALHLAAAILSDCDEFITTEKPDKPLFRLSDRIRIRSISA